MTNEVNTPKQELWPQINSLTRSLWEAAKEIANQKEDLARLQAENERLREDAELGLLEKSEGDKAQ